MSTSNKARGRRYVAAVAIAVAVALVGAAPSLAAPPANDSFDTATVVGGLPYNDAVTTTESTSEPGEPQACIFSSQTVWYAYTPTEDQVFRADTSGSQLFYNNLNVYRAVGSGIGGLSFIGCGWGSPVTVRASAGTTYYFQIGSLFGNTGSVTLRLSEIPAPANDDFADAAPVQSLPFEDTQNGIAASVEAGEPRPTCTSNAQGSWWYAFTPSSTNSYSLSLSTSWSALAVFTGSGFGELTQVACRSDFAPRTAFRATAGTTYYIQVTEQTPGQYGLVRFSLDVAPPPVAGVSLWPGDPSSLDTMQFTGQSHDPAGAAIVQELYDFGDGTSEVGCCPEATWQVDVTHRYAVDGDYTLTVTATTADGRTASTVRLIQVRTHDAGIAKLTVPQSAATGQTRAIAVGIANRRYPETVQVQLLKSVAGGFEVVGTLTQTIPALSGGRTTQYAFNYTFTQADATAGKVTFQAVATIMGARDALPGDNTVIALPTKVTR
jgi:hypothetical protein